MFHPEKEQLSGRTAMAHSASRWINQSAQPINLREESGRHHKSVILLLHCSFFQTPLCLCRASNTKIWIHSNVPSVASFRDVCVYSLSMTQSLPEILPDPPLSPFPRWHSKIHLRALTWIQNTSLLTTRITSFNLPVVAMVSFWLNVHTPSLQLASRRSTYLNRN